MAKRCNSWIVPVSVGGTSQKRIEGPDTLSMGASFDFSAPSEWDVYYENNPDVLEWHSSVPLERISSYITTEQSDVLLVGCGNSRLPETILSMHTGQGTRLVLLDTSQTCLDQLRQIHGYSVEYMCGNAVELDQLFPDREFDMVLDKGLSDALFCSEGWNGPIEKLYKGAAKILRPGVGQYLLVSYKLPSSMQDFLRDVGEAVGLDWEFDLIPDSNHRVGLSLAKKRSS